MFEKLELKNFQSHKDSTIEFTPGVNAIVGQSDSGKTSILRALNWVINNKPSGNEFIHHGQNEMAVSLYMQEARLTRIKGKSKNKYLMDDEEYNALGQSVPAEIESVLNMSDINFQKQMDSPFLLSSSPGQVGQYLNEITNLSVIDSSLKNANRKVRNVKSEIETLNGELKEQEEKIKQYDYLEDMKKQLNISDAIVKKLERLDTSIRDIEELINIIHEAEKVINIHKNTKTAESLIKQWEWKNSKLSDINHQIIKLSNIIGNYKAYNDTIVSHKNTKKVTSLIEKYEAKQHQLFNLSCNIETLPKIINDYKWNKITIEQKTQSIKDLKKELKSIQPKICPACGQEIKNGNV